VCGICGIVGAPDHEGLHLRVDGMVKTLGHRGPDHQAVLQVEPGTVLGHARLSILDLSPSGHQPMTCPGDQGVALVCNGEVYNYLALRDLLKEAGHIFSGHSDSEVVLAGYMEWGIEVVSRLRGMFALAIWDSRTSTLHLARDPIGIKPLYYEHRDGQFHFASEIKALLHSRPGTRTVDARALHEYLWFGNAYDERTLFRGIHRLRPGHRLSHGPQGTQLVEFHNPARVPSHPLSFEEAVEGTRTRLQSAVRSHLASDVPIGVFLSGGVDSAALVALSAPVYSGRLTTYTAAFDGASDELAGARAVADRFDTDHHELQIGWDGLPDLLRRLVRCHDEPFADPANLPLYLMSRQLGSQARVVLQGDGGDELFGGYRRYVLLHYFRIWKALSLFRGLGRQRQGSLYRVLEAMAASTDGRRMALLIATDTALRPPTRLLRPEVRDEVESTDAFGAFQQRAGWFAGASPAQQMLLTDLTLRLPNTFLEKVDKPTMAFGTEARVPFLDQELVEFAVSLPAEVKLAGGKRKAVLRAALRGVVPDATLDGPKVGLEVPCRTWLQGPLRQTAREAFLGDGSLLDSQFCLRLLDEGGPTDLIWRALQLRLWEEEYQPVWECSNR
jgi:asparagine synthase (glutamine-hydrolysing)